MPYETIDVAIDHKMQTDGLVDPPLTDWCSIPEGDPLHDVKRDWMNRCNIPGDGSDLLCCGLWGDGASYHTRDQLNMLLFNCLSGIYRLRMWIGVWSKRVSCQCGCKGQCTYDSFFRIISWVSQVWSTKVYPHFRDDNVPFSESRRPGDKFRAEKAGESMWVRGCFVQKRGDWA